MTENSSVPTRTEKRSPIKQWFSQLNGTVVGQGPPGDVAFAGRDLTRPVPAPRQATSKDFRFILAGIGALTLVAGIIVLNRSNRVVSGEGERQVVN